MENYSKTQITAELLLDRGFEFMHQKYKLEFPCDPFIGLLILYPCTEVIGDWKVFNTNLPFEGYDFEFAYLGKLQFIEDLDTFCKIFNIDYSLGEQAPKDDQPLIIL